jgi:hypothetical protein
MPAEPAIKFGISEANSLATAALQVVKQLRQAYIDAELLPEKLRDFHADLEHARDKFLPLSTLRLRTDAAEAAVRGLLGRVEGVIKEVEPELRPQPTGWWPRWRANMWQACCTCLAGPPKLQRRLESWKDSVKGALDAVDKEKDNLLPRVLLCSYESLPRPICVTNSHALSSLTYAVVRAAEDGGAVELLGMGGMGKSVLALQAAFDLEQGAAPAVWLRAVERAQASGTHAQVYTNSCMHTFCSCMKQRVWLPGHKQCQQLCKRNFARHFQASCSTTHSPACGVPTEHGHTCKPGLL